MTDNLPAGRRYAMIWVLLWVVGVLGMLPWLLAHAMFAMLAGLIGFDQLWLLPFGAVVLGLAVAALFTFRDPSPWRVLAIATFIGAAAAFLLTYERAEELIPRLLQFGVVVLAFIGVVLTVASYADADQP